MLTLRGVPARREDEAYVMSVPVTAPPSPPPPPPQYVSEPEPPPPPSAPSPPNAPSPEASGDEEITDEIVLEIDDASVALPPPPAPAPAPKAQPRYPKTTFLLGDGVRVVVGGRDSTLAARAVEALNLSGMARARTEIEPAVSGTFVGAFETGEGTVRVYDRFGHSVGLRPSRGMLVTGVAAIDGCAGADGLGLTHSYKGEGAQGTIAVLSRRALDPCTAFATAYPQSTVPQTVRDEPLALIRDHGDADATPLAWLQTWPALRHSLLPLWALPLAPEAEATRSRRAELGETITVALSIEPERGLDGPLAAEATFFVYRGRLMSVVAAGADRRAARDLLAATVASILPPRP